MAKLRGLYIDFIYQTEMFVLKLKLKEMYGAARLKLLNQDLLLFSGLGSYSWDASISTTCFDGEKIIKLTKGLF